MTTFDLVALGLVALFAVLGLLSGFARQVAAAVATVGAFVAAGPGGRFFAEPLAQRLGGLLTVGTVAATVLVFAAVWVVGRLVLTALLRGLLAGKDGKRTGVDRALGFALGGLKAAALVWVGVCAAVYLEKNLVVSGKRFTFAPKGSVLVGWAHQFNVVEALQFSGVRDLMTVVRRASDPKAAAKLKADPDYQALVADPRFQQVMAQDEWKKALQTGDVRTLLESNRVVELINDPKAMRHLERLAELPD